MNIINELETLYSLSSKGKVKQWSVSVEEKDGLYYVCSKHGYMGHTLTSDYSSAIAGKNIGKKNETTPIEQANLEALSKWNKKVDQNYTTSVPDTKESFSKLRPMLAHKFSERKHNIVYPAYVQPKLNGVRCLATRTSRTEIEFSSRGDKPFTTLDHLVHCLNHEIGDFPYPLDGEIFTPNLTFQEITSAVKRKQENTSLLEFHIFDIADTRLTFQEKLPIMAELFRNVPADSKLKLCPTFLVRHEEDVLAYHNSFSQSFEGTMIRNSLGKYVFDYRSTDLLKHKDFVDAEFLIIGGEEASGNDEGTVVFKCQTSDGKTFDVRPRGKREYRKQLFQDLNNLIGKYLTVRYQNFSDDGIPIFPVGVEIRDYE